MSDSATLVTLASAGIAAIGITAAAGLRGWEEWLDLKRCRIDASSALPSDGRVELTELRARIRHLESIANGSQI